MRFLIVLLISTAACTAVPVDTPPVVHPNPLMQDQIKTVAEAKTVAQRIERQSCKRLDFPNDQQIDDGGSYFLDCEHESFFFDLLQSHLYEYAFYPPRDTLMKFVYSEQYLMKPAMINGGARSQETNPLYYLRPVGEGIPTGPIPPPPLPPKS